MKVEIWYDDYSCVDTIELADERSLASSVYEVDDETAGRWLKAYADWDAAADEADRFAMDRRQERNRRDDEILRKRFGL